jgi:hypothetical protein
VPCCLCHPARWHHILGRGAVLLLSGSAALVITMSSVHALPTQHHMGDATDGLQRTTPSTASQSIDTAVLITCCIMSPPGTCPQLQPTHTGLLPPCTRRCWLRAPGYA